MFTKRLTTLALLCAAVLAIAAQDSLLLRDLSVVVRQDAWLRQDNAAALTHLSAPDIADAETTLNHERGGLTDYDGALRLTTADVCARAFSRLSRRTVVSGAISYQSLAGRQMTGSAFIRPGHMPFNLVEDSLTNAGSKHLDTYRLQGAVGVDVWHGTSVGARLAYTSANYAKYKDLRHKNKLMDLQLTLGLYAPLLTWLSAGADYQYSRQTESLTFGTYGQNDRVYKTLIDYGAFMGRAEQFAGEGFTDRSREMPFFEDGHGGGLQVEVRPAGRLSLMATARLRHASGYYGRRSPYTITYTAHQRDVAELTATVKCDAATAQHYLDAAFSRERLSNSAATFRQLTSATGAYYYDYYDPVETGDKWWRQLRLAWTSLLGLRGETPAWQINAACEWRRRTQLAYLYPYYRRQRLHTTAATLSLTRNVVAARGLWSFTAAGAFSHGGGTPADDGTFAAPGPHQEPPATMEAMLWREWQWLCAAQYRVEGAVQYAFIVPGTRLKTRLMLKAVHHKANETFHYSQGCDRTHVSLTAGCTF